MSPSTLRSGRNSYPALAGAAYPVLMVAAAAVFPSPPGGDVSPGSDPAWLSAHVEAVLGQSAVRALAALSFVVFTAVLAMSCRRVVARASALPAMVLLGGGLSGAVLLLAQAVSLAAALSARDGGAPAAIRSLGALQDALLDLSALPAVVLFLAVGLSALRTGLLPPWLSVLTLAGVPLALLDAASFDGGPFEAVGLIGLVYFLAWALLVSVRLAFPSGSPDSSAERAEPAVVS